MTTHGGDPVDSQAHVVPLVIGLEGMAVRPGGLNRVVAEHMSARAADGLPGLAIVTGTGRGRRDANVIEIVSGSGAVSRLLGLYRAVRTAPDFDVLVSHFALTGLPCVLATRRPVITAFHGPWAAEAAASGSPRTRVAAARLIERIVYRRSAAFITDSAAFRDRLVGDYGVHPGSVTVVPLGVDLDHFREIDQGVARRRVGLPETGFVAVCVRRLVPRMGHEQLLRAWRDVGRPDDVLVIVGDGPQRAELERSARELGIDSSVRFRGRVADAELPVLYAAADVSVIPTLELEGFGLISLESMACGTPVVASAQGGLLEALAGSDAHDFVPPGDVPALAQALVDRMGADAPATGRVAARSHAERFSWAAQVDGTDAAARQALTSPPHRPWRVVVVDHCARPSGGQIALERLVEELGDQAAVHVIAGEDGVMVDRWRAAGATVEVLGLPDSLSSYKRRDGRGGTARNLAGTAAAAYAVATRLRDLRPDLVHCNSAKACVYGGLAGRFAGCPVVWHVRDRVDSGYLPASTALLMRRAATVIPLVVVANSASTLATLPPVKRSVVGYSPVPEQPVALRPGVPVIGIAGRIADWKGHEVVLRAVAALDDIPDLRLRIAGAPLFGEADVLSRLQQLAGELGISDRVDWLGHVDDLGQERRKWGVALHASTIAEPFGMVVVEAMAAGLPIVATEGGGPSEVITDGVDGLLVPGGDCAALAAAIRRIVSDLSLARALSAAARTRAADFAPPSAARSVLGAWHMALGAASDVHEHGVARL